MVTPNKTSTHAIDTPEANLENKFGPSPIYKEKLAEQEKTQTRSTFMYVVLAIAVFAGGYYLYTTAAPSTEVISTITKTDMAPAANAPAASTMVAPATPMAAAPPVTSPTATPATPSTTTTTTDVPATPPAAGTPPAPAKTTP